MYIYLQYVKSFTMPAALHTNQPPRTHTLGLSNLLAKAIGTYVLVSGNIAARIRLCWSILRAHPMLFSMELMVPHRFFESSHSFNVYCYILAIMLYACFWSSRFHTVTRLRMEVISSDLAMQIMKIPDCHTT